MLYNSRVNHMTDLSRGIDVVVTGCWTYRPSCTDWQPDFHAGRRSLGADT